MPWSPLLQCKRVPLADCEEFPSRSKTQCPDTNCKLTKRTAGLLQEEKVNMTAFEVTDAMVEAYSHQAVAAVMDN